MRAATIVIALATLLLAQEASARGQIHIVGSSTVFPFATAVAERFAKSGEFKTPLVESTGTGGGMKLFCAGLGDEYPDITNASRELTDSELKSCAANGVTAITEIKIGFDGIVIANNVALPPLDVTLDELYLALAKEVPNGKTGAGLEVIPTPYQKWSEIDPALPRYRIEVYGPPPTSGTRDAFIELVMQPGCLALAPIRALKESGADGEARTREVCQTLRDDGGYIESGENDDLIVQKLEGYPSLLASLVSGSCTKTPTRCKAPPSTACSRPSSRSPAAPTRSRGHCSSTSRMRRRGRFRVCASFWPSSRARKRSVRPATWRTRAWCRCRRSNASRRVSTQIL
jgi:phosphate transport system substrate-binding protein